MERYENHTLEASRRRFATKATKKCCAEAAAALARAGDDVALIFAAQTYVDAAADLQAATPETKGDAHIRLRVAACGWFAELASVEDVGDAAAVAHAHALGKASTAVADAAEVVFAAESVADELAARQQLQVAEAAFERSYKATTARRRQTEARRPRPTSRAASPSSNNAYWRRVFAAQVDRREDLAARRPRPNSRTIHHLVAPQVPEPGAFKVIDPAGAELRSSSDDNDWKKVGHLTSGTVVVVDFVKKWLVSTPRACIVEQGRFVGWVDLVALARIGDDQRAATTRPRRATTRATTLYGSQGSRSPLVNWYAHEIGLELAMRAPRDETNPHPFGQVPALRDDADADGGELELFESGAILMYLADAYGGLDTPKTRAAAAAWVSWANASLDPVLFVENERGGVVDTKARDPNNKRLRRLDDVLASRDYLLGDFSVADVAVGAYLLYVPQFFPDVSFAPYPALARYMGRLALRDAYAKAFGADVRRYLVQKCVSYVDRD